VVGASRAARRRTVGSRWFRRSASAMSVRTSSQPVSAAPWRMRRRPSSSRSAVSRCSTVAVWSASASAASNPGSSRAALTGQAQSERLQVLDGQEPADVVQRVEAVIAGSPLARHEKSELVVVAQRSHGQPGPPGHLADLERCRRHGATVAGHPKRRLRGRCAVSADGAPPPSRARWPHGPRLRRAADGT
jgi:hypothetical protein